MFDRSKLAFELQLIAEHLTQSEQPATEEAEAEIVQHAAEECFSQAAIRIVGHLAVENASDPEQASYFDGLLRLMMTDSIPYGEQDESERLNHKLATIEGTSFLARLHEQQDRPVKPRLP